MSNSSTFTLISFCIVIAILIMYFCYWSHRRRRLQQAVQTHDLSSGVVVNRRMYRNGRPIYTIPTTNMDRCNFEPVRHGARGAPHIVFVTVTAPPIDDLPPPTYEEVTNNNNTYINTNTSPEPNPAGANANVNVNTNNQPNQPQS